jgi:hypothetical protein
MEVRSLVVRVCAVVDAYTCHTLLCGRKPPAVLCCLCCVVEWLNLSNMPLLLYVEHGFSVEC